MDGKFSSQRGPGFISRVSEWSNLRPFIIVVAIIGFLWSMFAGISSFRNVPYFNSIHDSKLGMFYYVSGFLCMAIAAIEAFGIFAVSSRKVKAVQLYAYLSVLAAALAATTYSIQAAVHAAFKNDIINLCTNANEGDEIIYTGFFGPVEGGIVSPSEAQEWCSQQYSHYTFSNIVTLIAVTIGASLFAGVVFAYLRQLRSPSDPIPLQRIQWQQNQQQPYNSGYNASLKAASYSHSDNLPGYDKGDFEGDGNKEKKNGL